LSFTFTGLAGILQRHPAAPWILSTGR